ncbi:ABC transporter substrate-binding protein [Natronomonas salina]|uniref:ABC transporter substrate-binding protein n=1 Tax=Natronomonas salina TaxID=1710540 RepID=UPI0015B746A3|nr:ABC transporter substrate-binding protein [Natronomonas salina]QLD90016.1 ABC transporter substrate-binding protein [Natronomonas salina]
MLDKDTDGSGTGTSGRTPRVRRRRFLTAAGAGATAAFAGCIGGNDDEGPITIGGVYLLSGLAEQLGASSRAAAEVAINEINDDGGILDRDVESFFRDHGDDPQSQIRSLVQEENADVMMGLTSSGEALNSGPVIEQLGVPFTLTDIGTPFLTEPDVDTYGDYYADEGTAAVVPNLFRTNPNTSTNTYAIAKWIDDNYGSARIANLGPDYAYGQQCWDYFQAYSDGLGAGHEYVGSAFPELGASDMTPQINQVMNADPDLLFTSFWGADVVTFVQQANEQGLFDQVDDVFDTIGADPNGFAALGDNMPEGLHYSGWYWPSAFDNEENTAFLEAYADEYEGSDVIPYPSFTGGSSYSAVYIYKEAMEAAGSTDPDDVVSEMEGMEHTGPHGTFTLDEDSHQATTETVIGETSMDADVPYDGVGLTNTETYSIDRSTAEDLLSGTDLPPGV